MGTTGSCDSEIIISVLKEYSRRCEKSSARLLGIKVPLAGRFKTVRLEPHRQPSISEINVLFPSLTLRLEEQQEMSNPSFLSSHFGQLQQNEVLSRPLSHWHIHSVLERKTVICKIRVTRKMWKRIFLCGSRFILLTCSSLYP